MPWRLQNSREQSNRLAQLEKMLKDMSTKTIKAQEENDSAPILGPGCVTVIPSHV